MIPGIGFWHWTDPSGGGGGPGAQAGWITNVWARVTNIITRH